MLASSGRPLRQNADELGIAPKRRLTDWQLLRVPGITVNATAMPPYVRVDSTSDVQSGLLAKWAEMPRSPGHVFGDRLRKPLSEAGLDAFVEPTCKPFHAQRMGAPSLPPGR